MTSIFSEYSAMTISIFRVIIWVTFGDVILLLSVGKIIVGQNCTPEKPGRRAYIIRWVLFQWFTSHDKLIGHPPCCYWLCSAGIYYGPSPFLSRLWSATCFLLAFYFDTSDEWNGMNWMECLTMTRNGLQLTW